MRKQSLTYTGTLEAQNLDIARDADSPANPEPYVAAKELVQAVNLALHLGRPLLLEGEAGCGKSRLARAVARELGLAFYPWYVRSTSKATDGLYVFDALKRLYDIETLKAFSGDTGKAALPRDPSEPKHYCTLGALGKAFEKRERPAVVLIDEIDKADLDFPNDLLTVLDDPWSFKIEETGETIKADESCLPLVIITSNKEKGNLPAPFLRRCIYQILSFPDNPADLQMIVDSHYADKAIEIPSELSRAAVKRFLGIRSQQGLFKRPGTSEFLDWLEALRTFETNGKLADVDAEAIPYPELLFKQRSDFQLQTRA